MKKKSFYELKNDNATLCNYILATWYSNITKQKQTFKNFKDKPKNFTSSYDKVNMWHNVN